MVILKILSLASTAIAAFNASIILRQSSPRMGPWFLRRSNRITEAADLAGVRISPRICALLAIVPFAALGALSVIRRRRLVQVDRQLPDALSLLGNAMRAGLSLPQALEMASRELVAPLGEEMSRAVAQLKLGRTAEEAMSLLAERMPTDDLELVVQSVEVLRRTGGNLIETFGTLAAAVEGRLAVEERIRVLTAQGVYQAIMLLAMPWAMGVALHVAAPDYLEPILHTRLGHAMIAAGVLLEMLGAAWLRRIVMIRV